METKHRLSRREQLVVRPGYKNVTFVMFGADQSMLTGMSYNDIPDNVRQQVVAMYSDGVRVTDIVDTTGLSRPTIYWVLRSEGQTPNRNRKGDTLSVQELLTALRETEKENGALRAEIEMLRRQMRHTIA
jgi:DNA invertase Pin-like site-specific DNA recombinase